MRRSPRLPRQLTLFMWHSHPIFLQRYTFFLIFVQIGATFSFLFLIFFLNVKFSKMLLYKPLKKSKIVIKLRFSYSYTLIVDVISNKNINFARSNHH